jgi:hypothetical protein
MSASRTLRILHIRQNDYEFEHFQREMIPQSDDEPSDESSEDEDAWIDNCSWMADSDKEDLKRTRRSRDSRSYSPPDPRDAWGENGPPARILDEYQEFVLTQASYEFIWTAFGPDGPPSLEVIALGDFSYQGRYAQSTAFLVRTTQQERAGRVDGKQWWRHYRNLLPTDYEQNKLIDKYRDVLAACPGNTVVDL